MTCDKCDTFGGEKTYAKQARQELRSELGRADARIAELEHELAQSGVSR